MQFSKYKSWFAKHESFLCTVIKPAEQSQAFLCTVIQSAGQSKASTVPCSLVRPGFFVALRGCSGSPGLCDYCARVSRVAVSLSRGAFPCALSFTVIAPVASHVKAKSSLFPTNAGELGQRSNSSSSVHRKNRRRYLCLHV